MFYLYHIFFQETFVMYQSFVSLHIINNVMEFKHLHFLLFVHLLILLVVSHHSLILIQCLNIFIFIFCKLEHFEISLAFFIEPSITWETKHLMFTYTCAAIYMMIYLENNILQLLPNCFRKFTKKEVYDMSLSNFVGFKNQRKSYTFCNTLVLLE